MSISIFLVAVVVPLNEIPGGHISFSFYSPPYGTSYYSILVYFYSVSAQNDDYGPKPPC